MVVRVIGDPHGTRYWCNHIKKFKETDKVVILGDYFDTWENDWSKVDQIENLKEIIDFKKKYPKDVDILIGNHDLAYITGEVVSGHQINKAIDIKEFLEKNLDYFDIACRHGDWVFSHAGFSAYWMRKYGFADIKDVNEAFHNKNYQPFKFCGGDPYGNDYLQGPTWIRPEALKHSTYFNKQIVGHTATDKMQTNHLKFKSWVDNKTKQEIYIVDKNDHSGYLELNI